MGIVVFCLFWVFFYGETLKFKSFPNTALYFSEQESGGRV